MRRLTDN